MSVRGSKSKVILYIGGVCGFLFVVLLYHNAAQKLEEVEKQYKRCHLNEESLSAQLQVNLEYKVRLEKSLQQEKSDHAQVKEDMSNKLEDERQNRERENLESINKFTALQQQYKFLQSQHEDLNVECNKLRQAELSEKEEKSQMDKQLQSLKNELKLFKESKDNDIESLKVKNRDLERENGLLKAEKMKLLNEIRELEGHNTVGSQIKFPDNLPLNSSFHKDEKNENILPQPILVNKAASSSLKSSTVANKAEQELFPPANNNNLNTSTPMINPDAVLSQDKMLNAAAPVPQPRQESYQHFPLYDNNKENVGAKPEEVRVKEEEVPAQGVLRAPDIMNDFNHVPAIQEYKERFRQGLDRNNNGGEVGDEGEPVVKHSMDNEKRLWREGEVNGVPFVRNSAGEIPKNQVYHYQAEYDRRKEEGEDDDDVDQLDYHNEKNHQQQQEEEEKPLGGIHVKIPFEDKRESVMIQPK